MSNRTPLDAQTVGAINQDAMRALADVIVRRKWGDSDSGSPLTTNLLCAEIARLNLEREWRSIETAPRDGTLFLAYVPDSSILEIVFCRRDEDDEDWMMDWGNERTVIDIPVTHWMPLPDAPP
jgi:hypothetical protein